MSVAPIQSRQQFGRQVDGTYSINDGEAAVRLAADSEYVAMDIETGAAGTPGMWNIKAFSISDGTRAVVLDPQHYRDEIGTCIEVAQRMVFHNANYDVPILHKAGLLELDDIDRVSDTIVTARLLYPDSIATPNTLDALSVRVLGPEYAGEKDALADGYRAVTGRGKGRMWDDLDMSSHAYCMYAAWDTLVTARLWDKLGWKLIDAIATPDPLDAMDAPALHSREQTVNRILLRRSAVGIELDFAAADALVDDMDRTVHARKKELRELGLDPDLPTIKLKQQILADLEAQGKIPESWPRLKNGGLTTNKTWMARLEDTELVGSLTEMLQAQRFIKDYAGGSADMAHDGRIHPQVSVLAAVTGRMSYGRPALQQYPGQVRKMFRFPVPVTSFDWSSIEPVIIANLAGEHSIIESYEAGGDVYEPIAELAGVERKLAKTVLLAGLYGQGIASLALRLNISEDEARDISRAVKEAMPRITEMSRMVHKFAEKYGYIQTISTRVIPLPPDPRSGNKRYLGHKGVNYLIQGSAYDLLAETLLAMSYRDLEDAVCLAIHDELVVHTSVADEVASIMTRPPQCLITASGRTPILRVGRSDLGHHWNEKE